MGGAFVAVCNDVTSCAWNPAGLVHVESYQAALNHVSWPADISYNHACVGVPVRAIDGTVAVQFGALSTDIMETTEYHPYGTGREFTFSDWLVGLSVAKRFTDRFSGGIAIKYVREELGVEIGGPKTDAMVVDAGTYYEIGPRNMRLAVALMNFGPDMAPGGTYYRATGTAAGETDYEGYAPATEFKFGIAFEPWTEPWLSSIVDVEMLHPADNKETFRFGGEALLLETLALRAGYDSGADEMKTSLGLGARVNIASRLAQFDYAATLTEHLGTVHRFSLTMGL
jgi:hypothetical protein